MSGVAKQKRPLRHYGDAKHVNEQRGAMSDTGYAITDTVECCTYYQVR
ncbi:MAG: hypothetical protein MI861_01985 [Pirellulales bacterium]|nr:hypothetical protein [Pirellulales bacterium]